MSRFIKPSRRLFILGGLGAGGGLVVGWALISTAAMSARAKQLGGLADAPLLAGSVRIARDDSITVIVPHVEMGQGVHTALPMMLAEELEADWSRVSVEQAPADVAFANGALARGFTREGRSIPAILSGLADFTFREAAEFKHLQITGGSTAVRCTGVDGMRRAGAAARLMLVQAAADAWAVPASDIVVEASRLAHAPSGRSATFGAMAEAAARFTPSATAPLKERAAYTIVGTNRPRFDIPAKVDGTAVYGADVRLPGLLFGAIAAAPVFGATLQDLDPAPALAMRGVHRVARLADAVVVLGDNTWRARQALAALRPVWSETARPAVSSPKILAEMEAALAGADLAKDYASGDVEAGLARAKTRVEAVYRVPYLSHAQLEPINCTAWLRDCGLDVWGAFQDPLAARFEAARLAGLEPDAVRLHLAAFGGAFGRRLPGATDFLERAVAVAKQVDRPVQIAWSREEDMTQGFYRQAAVAHLTGGLDAAKRVTGWRHVFCEKHDPPDAALIDYDIPDRVGLYATGHNPVPWGNWRGVDHSVHGFSIESFMDELAHAAGVDPFEFRRAHLSASPRHQAVLDRVAALSGWGQTLEGGRARGIALRQAFGTIVAQVAEVGLEPDGRIRVHALFTACDAGEVVHPENFIAQIKGGAIFALSAALYGAITLENGRVVETNFTDYDMVRLADAPVQRVSLLETPGIIGGGGEPGIAPVAAAVANAAFALTGFRARDLPLRTFNFKAGTKFT